VYWEKTEDRRAAEEMAQRAAEAGNPHALDLLATMRETSGDRQGAEQIAQRAADVGNPHVLARLAVIRQDTALAQRAADAGIPAVVAVVAAIRGETRDRQGDEQPYRAAFDARNFPSHVNELVRIREDAGHWQEVEELYSAAVDAADTDALARAVLMREETGDRQGAEALALQVANAGGSRSPYFSKSAQHDRWPHGLDPDGTPTTPW
jgi:hypothetical protein